MNLSASALQEGLRLYYEWQESDGSMLAPEAISYIYAAIAKKQNELTHNKGEM